MRGAILTALILAGVASGAVAQPTPGTGGAVGAGAAGIGVPGADGNGTVRPEAAPSRAQPRGMVGGAGGPGGATNAGRAGDTAGVAGPQGATTEGGGSAGGGSGVLR